MNSVSMITTSAMVAMAKKIPRSLSVRMPANSPSSPLITKAAAICRGSGSAKALYSTAPV